MEINTQMCGIESTEVAHDIAELASVQDCFNNVDDEEVLRLLQRAKEIYARVYGTSSVNVAVTEGSLSNVYGTRACRARAANDLDRELTNLELALAHISVAARIYRAINHTDMADYTTRKVLEIEERLQQARMKKAAMARKG